MGPCLGPSSSRCCFMSPRICLKPREWSRCIVQSIFSKTTVTMNFLFSRRAHLLSAFCPAVTSVPCQMASLLTVTLELYEDHFHILWVFLLHKEPAGFCCYGDSANASSSWDYCNITAAGTAAFCRTISSLFPFRMRCSL